MYVFARVDYCGYRVFVNDEQVIVCVCSCEIEMVRQKRKFTA